MFFEECPKRRVSLGVLNPLQINGNKKNTIDVRTLGGSDVNGVFNLVEAGRVELPSESNLTGTSPGAVRYLHSLIRTGTDTLPDLVAS